MLWFAGMQTVKLPVLDQKFWELFMKLVSVAENMLPLGSHSLIVGKTLKNEGHCAGGWCFWSGKQMSVSAPRALFAQEVPEYTLQLHRSFLL